MEVPVRSEVVQRRMVMNSKPLRPKRCKACKEQFTPARLMQSVCGPACALVVGHAKLVKKRAEEAKIQRQKDRKARECLKTRSSYIKEAQSAFNAYIRARDHAAGYGCISCGRHHDGQYHAGHYLSVGARPELRFSESNCHLQCAPCNTYLSGNLVLYRLALLGRIGEAKVAMLEGPATPLKLSIEEIKTIRDTYRTKVRELKKQA